MEMMQATTPQQPVTKAIDNLDMQCDIRLMFVADETYR